jgi:uncharacterized lipoprotein YajG
MNAKQIITSNKTILAAALLTLCLTGCALTPATESLNYQAQTGVAHVAHAENVTVNVVTTDSRVDKAIGHKKNTWGMITAGISADEPVEVIVDRAIEQELKNRGFHIARNSGVIVHADVTKFNNEFSLGFWQGHANGQTTMLIDVKNNGNEIYKKMIDGTNSDGIQLATGGNAKASLEKALANAMTELFNDPAFIAALTTAAPAQAAPK